MTAREFATRGAEGRRVFFHSHNGREEVQRVRMTEWSTWVIVRYGAGEERSYMVGSNEQLEVE